MENNETLLTQLYKSQAELTTNLTPSQIHTEIEYLCNLGSDLDTLQTLFIIENLSTQTNKHEFYQAALNCIKPTPKYMIYNIRILNIINKSVLQQNKYFPLASTIIQLLNLLKVEEEKTQYIDMNKIKVGSDVAKTTGYVEFVVEKLISTFLKNINVISNCLGFPEIGYWIVKELKIVRIECKAMAIIKDLIERIEGQRKYLMEERNKLKPTLYDRKKVENIEKNLNKILE